MNEAKAVKTFEKLSKCTVNVSMLKVPASIVSDCFPFFSAFLIGLLHHRTTDIIGQRSDGHSE